MLTTTLLTQPQGSREPAAQGRAVIFGPHTDNFRRDVELLLAADAVVPKDQRLALDRVPGWFSNAGEEVRAMTRRGRLERRARSERRPWACERVTMD